MNSTRDKNEKLRRILRQAYREKEKMEGGDLSPEDLMRRIRQTGAIQLAPPFIETFEPFVWRLAPVMCLLILVLTALSLTLDFTSGYDLFQVFMNGKEEVTLAQLFVF